MKQAGNLSILSLVLVALSAAFVPSDPDEPGGLAELWDFLDRDGDGLVSRYEGAEAFLFLTDQADADGDGALAPDELRSFFAEARARDSVERMDEFVRLDADGDGRIVQGELSAELGGVLVRLDRDGDGALAPEELRAATDRDFLMAMFEGELLGLLEELDRDGDGALAVVDLPPGEQEELAPLDVDADGVITREELFALAAEELSGATFDVDGSVAEMTGVIGPSTPGRVLELILAHPEVRTIVMREVPGSLDDESNLRAARLVRSAGLATHVPADGEVASGGTDFFLAGSERSAAASARFGVHSWGGFGEEGTDVPRDDPEHEKYLDYYRAMGTPEEFYWYTLEAAPADGIHWMTAQELERYRVLTALATEAGAREELATDEPELDEQLAEDGLTTLAYFPVAAGRVLASSDAGGAAWESEVRRVWTELLDHLPESTRGAVAQIRGIRLVEGEDAPPGAAGPADDDPHGTWEILLARDALREEGLLWVLAHEYGHVLSLGDAEVTLEEGPHLVPSGPRFGEFFDRYWRSTGLFDAFQTLNPEGSFDPEVEVRVIGHVRGESGLVQEFVSEFAMVSPEEDFTETFAAYVLGEIRDDNKPVPGGGKDKLAWFARTYPKDEAAAEGDERND